MRSILKYDTNRINVIRLQRKIYNENIFENGTVRDYPNLLKSDIFFHSSLNISSQTSIVTSQPFAGLRMASLVYFLSQ